MDAADPIIMKLPPILDLRAAAPLADGLRARRGAPLILDASQVERLGGLCLQVLLAAQTTWREDGVRLRVAAPSDAFLRSARDLGALPNAPEAA